MTMKRFLASVLVSSWLWCLHGLAPGQASASAPEETSPQQVDETEEYLPPDIENQADSVTIETGQPRHLGVSPNGGTEHHQKLCESPEVVVASCEPTPGSPLSAFPLVLNRERLPRTLSSST
jgi:hypothetical protein